MNLTDRLITAIVEKCDGLSITAEQASNILAYLQYGAPLARQPAAIDKEAILTVDMVRDAVFDAGFALPQWDRIRFQLNSALRKARATSAPSVEQDERVRQFEALCDLLPSDVSWGDHLTPDIALHIARAASTSANVAQGAEAVEGWESIRVKNFLPFVEAVERAIDKGYLPDAMMAEWVAFEFSAAPPAQTEITDDARGKSAGYFLNCAAKGQKPNYLPIDDEYKDGPDVVELFFDAAQSASGSDHAN